MKMILDLDTGIDDAFALAYAIAHPDIELIGVTGTYGNVTIEQGMANTRALLKLLGQPDIPVYDGVEIQGFVVSEASARIHGTNGVGEVDIAADNAESAGEAVDFLIESAAKYGEDLVVVPTGAQTTIAKALEKDETLRGIRMVTMGGALTVPGNVSPAAEANISQDPVSSNSVYQLAEDMTMVGLDVTMQTQLTRAEADSWRGTAAGDAFADMAGYYIDAYQENNPHMDGCALHDPLAVAVAVDPDLVDCLILPLQVDTEGPTVGRTIGRWDGSEVETRVAVGVDVDAFVTDFVDKLGQLFARLAQ
ncbi:nucleoside hydrolase [Corynebacterium sp.]|uniref:nucleoside hydrolase n=1 Tax=Corynebacterium sp. TaxID=1720 RepID=UPI0028ACA560|nr:nucleoside hydrolase [Corynebacterium sp.]